MTCMKGLVMTEHFPSAADVAPLMESFDERLARILLTECMESANALMTALLKGFDGAYPASQALHALLAIAVASNEAAESRAWSAAERVFILDTARWGRKAHARGVDAFKHAAAHWIECLEQLPTFHPDELQDIYTEHGDYQVVVPGDLSWPISLNDLELRSDWAPPLALWLQGDIQALTACERPLSVVGSRGVNDYGRHVARTLACQTALNGHTVVSGGAIGADAAAHWGALDAMAQLGPDVAGPTIAVFAGGLNHCGPLSNMRLFEQIRMQHGALISECVPSTVPEARRFLLRNRIIAALSYTVVVAQARLRSGALNTAGWANELNRRLFAAPGDITMPSHAGCNKLIADQEAYLLSSTSNIDEICHESHEPRKVGKSALTTFA